MKLNKKKQGISLLVLVIVIIVTLIIVATVVITFKNDKTIRNASETKFKSDITSFRDELSMWVSREYGEKDGKLNLNIINATKDTSGYKNILMQEMITSMSDIYANKLEVKKARLKYIGKDPYEKKWFEDIFGKDEDDKNTLEDEDTLVKDAEFYSSARTNDGGFVAVGRKENLNTGNYEAAIIKFNIKGDTEWTSYFAMEGYGYETFYSVIKVNDGYICAGDIYNYNNYKEDAIVVKYDNNGQMQWSRILSGSKRDVFLSIAKADRGFICAGYTDSPDLGATNDRDGLLVKYDDDGNQEWIKLIDKGQEETFNSIIKTNDNGYLCVGEQDNYSSRISSSLIIKLDNYGEVIWEKSYNLGKYNEFIGVTEVDDGYIAVGSLDRNSSGYNKKNDSLIVKYSKSGTQLWDKVSIDKRGDYFNSVIKINEGFMCAGTTLNNDYNYEAVTIKYDNLGNELWSRSISTRKDERYNDILQLNNDRFVAVGTTDGYYERYGLVKIFIVPRGN